MSVLKLKVEVWVCDSGIYCGYAGKFIGKPLGSERDANKIVEYLNTLDKDDLNSLYENYISHEKVQTDEWALRQIAKLKGC